MDESSRRPTASGVARRRRERRLRSWWRHEQQSIRMALGAAAHHSAQQDAAPRSQRTGTRAGEGEVFESREAPWGQNTPHPGERRAPLLEVRPLVWAQRHSVVQVVGAVSGLPTLDVPVPQMVDQLLSFLTALDSFDPEQVIEVPKISTPSRCPRTVLSVPQTAEQLVEVQTIISYSREVRISERNVEQTVFPSRYERSSERTVEQLVDIPVYDRGASSRRGPQEFVPAVPGQSSTAFGGGLQDFLPGQGSIAFSGAEHAHVAPRRSRRGGGPVGRPQHSVSGQSSTARGRGVAASSSPVRRPSSAEQPLVGSESSSRGRGTSPKALPSRSRSGRIQTASWRPSTSRRWVGGERLGIPLTTSWVPVLFGVFVLPETYSLGCLWFRIVRFPWSCSGYSTCVSRRCFWLLCHPFPCEGRPRILRSIHDLTVTCSLLVSPGKCTMLDFSGYGFREFPSPSYACLDTPCIWQSLVRCLKSTVRVYSGRRLPDMPYSALLGSIVDACYCQSTSVFLVLFPYSA